MSKKAAKLISDQYTWQAIAISTIGVYEVACR